MGYTKLWIGFGAVIVLSFAVLGYYGREIYRQAPPIPERVVTDEGEVGRLAPSRVCLAVASLERKGIR